MLVSRLAFFFGLCPFVIAAQRQEHDDMNAHALGHLTLAGRGIISTIVLGSSSSSISSSTTSSTSSWSSTSSTTTAATTGPLVLALTTTFNPPPQCTGESFTEVPDDPGDILHIAIDTAVNGSYTSCLPNQFYRSVLAEATGASLPPFSALICPSGWESYDLNSTYVICCPNKYGLVGVNKTNTQRPGLDAVCTSYVPPNGLLDITSYDSTGALTIIPATAPANGTVVRATAFDGLAPTPYNITTEPTSTIALPTSTSTSAGVPVTSTSSSSGCQPGVSLILLSCNICLWFMYLSI